MRKLAEMGCRILADMESPRVNQFNVRFNDAKWNQQWYLQKKKANQKLSMRVEDAWAAGYTGKGITVRVFESREIMDTVKNRALYSKFQSFLVF